MNFGFRYHVASLMAVFFSLILGILIGGALFPDHALVDEQATLITELEERVRENQANFARVQAELDTSNLAWEHLLAALSPDLLMDRTIALVNVQESSFTPLAEIFQGLGAEVQELKDTHLSDVIPAQDVVFVFSLTADMPSKDLQTAIGELVASGANIAFVWDSDSHPVLENLPQSLMVDSIDTSVGKLAFVLGVARKSLGHFGRQKGAQGLFP